MDRNILVKKYFDDHRLIESSINSFNEFLENGMQKVVDERKEAEPTIIPQNIDSFKIKFGDIRVGEPEITEADGSKRKIFPLEARLRDISYSAPIHLEVSAEVNDVQRENFTAQIGRMPIMLQSDHCHLSGLDKEEMIKKGEDPNDPGGYFIINGSEKVLINIEDLASNNFVVEEKSRGKLKGKVFSESGSQKVLHTLEQKKDGIFYLTFTRVNEVPLVLILKALGMTRDDEIAEAVTEGGNYPEVLVNLAEFSDIDSQEEALDQVAKQSGITRNKDVRIEQITETLTEYLLPHLGMEEDKLKFKAKNLCKMWKKYMDVNEGEVSEDDKDHYMNKKIKLSGDLLEDLFRTNFKALVGDLLYNFQRIVKRGRLPSIKVIIREKLLTSRIHSAMATGSWVGGRTGVSQRMQRLNFLDLMSHLQRVVSPLSSRQENFEARALHSTHLGRLGPIETPEGTNIGLRKNLALLCNVSHDSNENQIKNKLEDLGVDLIEDE